MGHMSIHQARHLGQHIHGDIHHRRAPAPEPEPEAAAYDGLEAATNIKIPTPDRAALAPRSTETANADKPVTTSTFTMPIALGIVIPVVAAAIWFIYLHRRHIKKQREEDANDRHKSLDFGMGDVPGGMKGANATIRSMADAEKGISPTSRSARQKSMDMNLESPYLLPPEVHNSRESLQTLSKTIHQEADPYRPVTQYTHSDAASIRSFPRDNASTYTRSSAAPSRIQESSDLLGNAASIGRSDPPLPGHFPQRQNSLPQDSPSASPIDEPRNSSPLNPNAPGLKTKDLPSSLRPGSMLTPTSPLAAIENLATPAPIPTIKMPEEPTLPTPGPTLQKTPNRKPAPTLPGIVDMPSEPEDHLPVIQPVRESVLSEASDYGDAFQITPPSPTQEQKRSSRYSMDVPPEEFAKAGLGAPGFDPKRLSMGFRPLPPDAVDAAEDPEARANRIRSFYKEYFDDTKPAPAGQYYGEDENYLGDAAYFDPDSKNFVMPYAEPVTRRAMTPPPRGPRFMGPPRAMHGSMGGGPMRGPSPGPRAQSSASQRGPGGPGGPGGPRGPPKKPLPPPSPLSTLPTPSQLKDDSFAIMGALDFAPPTTYRDRQAGIRPESPMGERRPYSPHVPSATPLVSTFDELAAIPSPHMLRKSGTFTSLDFAAPRKFRDPEASGSDAGSIRSNRSGVSQMQQTAIRNGAYRVSRLPQDMVFSKDDLSASLKPTWGMRQGTTPHPSQTQAPGSMPSTPK